ncbi:hypothetical protein AB1A81_09655 [Bdellovibrio bacteriovorus]|uniref:Uncharacterized protein n=1 Tax=Bdellovibrio bacteriovorus (strain ATCC 15356 / DSM 50701 / NCIMB 9529 / HD100) TaxID=264462 RepID=Q6MLA6_BDEBA|nr:hypothetical protein [Bdellovibrio bacteriovorus]AHZ84597.1 hypothetical protein EP01_06555 [Bdellovibrio bacteriovorus]BEV68486.1 hypothetical protein Bb109J_c1906 [Bdellovibrio bacteriovorus]CAE79951.1 hypothetical protein predicted by Glimmer/Critica [Bdellovibrio bacteriovorus HD100]
MSVPALKDAANGADPSKKREDGAFFDMNVDKSDLGRPESLRYNILTWVLDERYDRAIEELKDFLEKPSEYPNFQDKVTRYINHSIDLIYAIKAKRSFPGINSLTRAKQQELREKFKEHFRELQYVLKIVEKVQGDLRIQDVRSTIYVVKAAWFASLAVIILAFWLDIVNGLAKTSVLVFDDGFGKLANVLAEMIGF